MLNNWKSSKIIAVGSSGGKIKAILSLPVCAHSKIAIVNDNENAFAVFRNLNNAKKYPAAWRQA